MERPSAAQSFESIWDEARRGFPGVSCMSQQAGDSEQLDDGYFRRLQVEGWMERVAKGTHQSPTWNITVGTLIILDI